MSKPASFAVASSSSALAPAPLPTPWSLIARQGVVNARLEAQRKAALRPVSTAHRHAIESILAFLSLGELVKANHVSRHWHNAVQHMRPLGASVELNTALEQCDRNSAMFRHVTTVNSDRFMFGREPPMASDLLHLFASMPQLRSVTWQLRVPCDLIEWPATLTEIQLHVLTGKDALNMDDATLLFKSISTSARALKRLTLRATLRTLRGLDFGFLLDLSELLSLCLGFERRKGNAAWRLGDSQVHVLRQLTQLTSLEFGRVEMSSLCRLFQPPHQLALAHVEDFVPLNAQAAVCLSSLPSLVELNARLCSSVAFLASLPLLATLVLSCRSFNAQEWLLTADEVLQGLSPCKALTDLTLTAPLQSSHLIFLLPRLSKLSCLHLRRMHCMDSLRCFSTGPVTTRLTSLSLTDCQHRELELNELGHLHRLKNLQSLSFHDSFNQSLTPGDIANYTPPSRFFKRLRHFHHRYTVYDDDDIYWGYNTDDGTGFGDSGEEHSADDEDEGEDADH